MDNNKTNQCGCGMEKKKRLLRIVFPLLIILAVFLIWIVKNKEKSAGIEGAAENPDFSLLVTDSIDLEQLKSYGIPIIIDFGADSCIPCKEMAPVLRELNNELRGKAIVKFVDVWKYQELAQGYPVSVIPTQVLITSEGTPYIPTDESANGVNMYSDKVSGEHIFTTHEGGITKEALLTILEEMGMEND